MSKNATRLERLHFNLTLNREQAEDHAADVKLLLCGGTPPTPRDDDSLMLHYEVFCGYYDNVEARLAAIGRLLDVPGLTREVNLEELNYGHSLFVGIIRQIEALQAKLGGGVDE